MIFVLSVLNLPIIGNCIYLLFDSKQALEQIKKEVEHLEGVKEVSDIYTIHRAGDQKVTNIDVVLNGGYEKGKIYKQIQNISQYNGIMITKIRFQSNQWVSIVNLKIKVIYY